MKTRKVEKINWLDIEWIKTEVQDVERLKNRRTGYRKVDKKEGQDIERLIKRRAGCRKVDKNKGQDTERLKKGGKDIESSVAEPKLFIFGSGSDFGHNFGSGSGSSSSYSYSHI